MPKEWQLDRDRLADLLEQEEGRFVEDHPGSQRLFERGEKALLGGVPMPWMTEWASPFPVFAADAEGARFEDVDGNEYVDLCLGDTGAMTGHSPEPTVKAVADRAARGITLMLPTEDASWVAAELGRRFGLPRWQFALTATDANRFALRLARAITDRPKVLVYAWCYHGTVDESFAIELEGQTRSRPDNIGPPVDPAVTTRAVEWNDLAALERALEPGDVACVLAEPAMTNAGIVLPDPGYHEALRAHPRARDPPDHRRDPPSARARAATAAAGLDPDLLTIGKAIAGGIPAAACGMTEEVAERIADHMRMLETTDVGGIGGTLAGNALSLAAARATLEEVLTDEAFGHMTEMAERFEAGVNEVVAAHAVPWNSVRLGCRVEYHFQPSPPRNGSEAVAGADRMLVRYMHLHALNRGILLTPSTTWP
jgi:glutamate-1-semialdehyde 2,1-aminomutase